MTTYALEGYNDPELLGAVIDVIAQLPEQQRHNAAHALEEHRVSIVSSIEPGIDGTPMLVLDLSFVDDHGSHLIARFDGARFGFYAEPDGSVTHNRGPQ